MDLLSPLLNIIYIFKPSIFKPFSILVFSQFLDPTYGTTATPWELQLEDQIHMSVPSFSGQKEREEGERVGETVTACI